MPLSATIDRVELCLGVGHKYAILELEKLTNLEQFLWPFQHAVLEMLSGCQISRAITELSVVLPIVVIRCSNVYSLPVHPNVSHDTVFKFGILASQALLFIRNINFIPLSVHFVTCGKAWK